MIDYKSKKVIIWDWNGTLLNDTAICVECMNLLLLKRELPILDKKKYRKIFTFPVKTYYKNAGFDFEHEPFEIPAMEFIEYYHQTLSKAELFSDVLKVLKYIENKGLTQLILSAMEHDSLVKSLTDNEIVQYFDDVSGIDNHYAHSKLKIGEDLINKIDLPKKQLLIIGDSLHDLEVSDALGIDCLLIANGHQSKERLINKTPHVIEEIKDVINLLD